LRFEVATGHRHPNHDQALANWRGTLRAIGKPPKTIAERHAALKAEARKP